jgi:hypothetical protein
MADDPTTFDLLGPPPGPRPAPAAAGQQEQTTYDLLGPPPGPRPATNYEPPSPVYDYIFRNPANQYGKLLGDFGMGFSEGFGTGPLGVGPETEDWLKTNGYFNDEQKKQQDIKNAWEKGQVWPLIPDVGRAINKFGIQGTVGTFNVVARGLQGAITGGAGAIGGVAEQTGLPQFADWLRGHEYQPGEFGAALSDVAQSEMMAPHGVHVPESARPTLEPTVISDARNAAINALSPEQPTTTAGTIRDARSMGIIGTLKNDEGVWKGTVDRPYPDPAPLQARALDAEKGIEAPPPQATAPDIHAVARQLAPDTFAEYDPLVTQQTFLRSEISRFEQDRVTTATAPIDEEIKAIEDRVGGAVDSLPEKEYGEYQALLDKRDDIAQQAREDAGQETAEARQRLQETTYRMRDLAPDVSAAYRRAEAGETPTPAEPAAALGPGDEAAPILPIEPETPAKIVPAAVGLEPTATAAPRVPSPSIAADVSQRLVDAGRPADEAAAASQIVAAHYEARAERFEGAKGSADEMYQRDAAQIKAGEEGGRGGNAQGKATIKNGRTIITLFRKADASTFLHETGHHWLEELMTDAKDEDAPQGVKDDAAAVRKWAGADEEGPLTTKQHEKFARAFERYFLEGRAPSSRLAGVFEQFKGWLGQIYGAASKMREPISADIRDVFDRLLSKPSERAVTTPEPAKEFADIHVADAEHTPPKDAGPAADTIEREVDELAAQHSPAVSEGLNGPVTSQPGRPAGGTTPEPAAAPGAPGNAGQPEPVGAGQSVAGQPSAQPGGSGEAPGQSGGVPAQPARQPVAAGQRVAARGKPETDQPAGPNSRLSKPEGRYVDKAGNIVLKNLNTPEDINAYYREMADQNDDFMAARRGVVSDAQVADTAQSMGLKVTDLSIQRLRSEFSAEQVYATRQLFIQTGKEVRDAAIAAKDGGLEGINAYAQARSRLMMVQEYLSAITAETGRALRAFRNVGEGFGEARDMVQLMGDVNEPRTLFQMQAEAMRIARFQTPAQVVKLVRDINKPSLGGMLQELFVNNLISGPITHMTYATGNEMLSLWKSVPETAVAAALGKIKEMATGQAIPERVRIQEVTARMYALFKGQKDGLRAAWDAVRAGQTTELPNEVMDRLTASQHERYAADVAAGTPHEEAIAKLQGPNGTGIKTPFTQTKQIPGILGTIVRLPGERMIAPIHSYFRTMNYAQGIAAQAVRQAYKEGLTGNKLDMRIADLTANPTAEMMAISREQATELTLMGHGGELTQAMGRVINWEPKLPLLGKTKPISFVDPFITISSNILKQSVIERTPFGLLSGAIREDLSGRNGTVAQTEAASRMLCGTGLAIVAGGLAAQGIITGSGPSDPHRATLWRAQFGMPHSIRIGDMSYDLSHLGPLGLTMGIAADMYHSIHLLEEDKKLEAAQNIAHSLQQNFLDESFMKGVSDLMKALDDNDRYGESYARNMVASFVPFSSGLGQAAHEMDPYQRQARTILDAIKAKIPWESETLLPRIDIWGNPIPNKEWAGLYATRLANDPVNKALLEMPGYEPGLPERRIVGVQLTDAQYTQYCQVAGRISHQLLSSYVANPGWSQMPVLIRHDLVKTSIEAGRAMARGQLKIGSIGADNDIIAKARGHKLDQFSLPGQDADDY